MEDWHVKIFQGDSKEKLNNIPDNSVDFILTDPPYNIAKYSTGNIFVPRRSFLNNDIASWDLKEFKPEDWVDHFKRVLKTNGNLFIFTSYNQLGQWYDCLNHKFDRTQFMVWHKKNPAPKIYKAGFLNSCELIICCWNKGHKWNFLGQDEMHNFIESYICAGSERLSNPKHPAQKPVEILKKMIEIASNENDIILDPFMGVGSTGAAALKMKRRFIGIEYERQYYKAAETRLRSLIG